jgi:hypothetical protein
MAVASSKMVDLADVATRRFPQIRHLVRHVTPAYYIVPFRYCPCPIPPRTVFARVPQKPFLKPVTSGAPCLTALGMKMSVDPVENYLVFMRQTDGMAVC